MECDTASMQMQMQNRCSNKILLLDGDVGSAVLSSVRIQNLGWTAMAAAVG
jgi:hypothetical protein